MALTLYLIDVPNDSRTWELPTHNRVSEKFVDGSVTIEENENGNIHIEGYTCKQTEKNIYFRVSVVGKKLEQSNWIKRFSIKR